MRKPRTPLQVFVHTPSDAIISCKDLCSDIQVKFLKSQLELRTGILGEVQDLYLSKLKLDNEKKLCEIGIVNGSVLRLKIKERSLHELYLAAYCGDIEEVFRLGVESISTNKTDGESLDIMERAWNQIVTMRALQALFAAAHKGHLELTKALLTRGAAGVNMCSMFGRSVLHVAASSGDVACVSMLLGQGVDAKRADVEGNSALTVAAQFGHLKVEKRIWLFCWNQDVMKDVEERVWRKEVEQEEEARRNHLKETNIELQPEGSLTLPKLSASRTVSAPASSLSNNITNNSLRFPPVTPQKNNRSRDVASSKSERLMEVATRTEQTLQRRERGRSPSRARSKSAGGTRKQYQIWSNKLANTQQVPLWLVQQQNETPKSPERSSPRGRTKGTVRDTTKASQRSPQFNRSSPDRKDGVLLSPSSYQETHAQQIQHHSKSPMKVAYARSLDLREVVSAGRKIIKSNPNVVRAYGRNETSPKPKKRSPQPQPPDHLPNKSQDGITSISITKSPKKAPQDEGEADRPETKFEWDTDSPTGVAETQPKQLNYWRPASSVSGKSTDNFRNGHAKSYEQWLEEKKRERKSRPRSSSCSVADSTQLTKLVRLDRTEEAEEAYEKWVRSKRELRRRNTTGTSEIKVAEEELSTNVPDKGCSFEEWLRKKKSRSKSATRGVEETSKHEQGRSIKHREKLQTGMTFEQWLEWKNKQRQEMLDKQQSDPDADPSPDRNHASRVSFEKWLSKKEQQREIEVIQRANEQARHQYDREQAIEKRMSNPRLKTYEEWLLEKTYSMRHETQFQQQKRRPSRPGHCFEDSKIIFDMWLVDKHIHEMEMEKAKFREMKQMWKAKQSQKSGRSLPVLGRIDSMSSINENGYESDFTIASDSESENS